MSCRTIIAEKNTKGYPPDLTAINANTDEIIPFMSQREKLPRLWPLAHTRFGNTSPIYTQMTAPCENRFAARTNARICPLVKSLRVYCATRALTR
jgi:hypothetical protein